MKTTLLRTLTIFFLLMAGKAIRAQIIVQIDAGSRAPYGEIQTLDIYKNGSCKYMRYDVQTRAIYDTASFVLSGAAVDSFLTKADEVGFFELQKTYHRGLDGTGIFIALAHGANRGSVDLKNTDIPQINSLIATLNTILKRYSIYIDYDQH